MTKPSHFSTPRTLRDCSFGEWGAPLEIAHKQQGYAVADRVIAVLAVCVVGLIFGGVL